MLNKSTSCKEIADTQASLYLWNMPAQFGNVRNSFILNDSFIKIKERLSNKKKKTIHNISNKNKYIKNSQLIHDESNYDELNKDDTITKNGGATLYKVIHKNKFTVIPVSQDTHYSFRGTHLAELSLLEYCCIIEIIPRNEILKSHKNVHKRQNNTIYAFQDMHLLHLSHAQRIGSKLLIPLLVGGCPKNFDTIDNNNMQSIYNNCSRIEKKN